ncbi:Superfamily I DNA and RNA helicases-like protein [Paraglaciecola sp. T6c]|nr:Superfamily I DNA and RNA helicases-like protein [Paraglaciecola sp. T6c]
MLASDLNENRGKINSILHSRTNIFHKNSDNQWGVIEKEQSDTTSKFLDDYPAKKNVSVTIVVENIDLVERIKDELKKTPNQKPRSLSGSLNEPRQLVTRTLHSYQDVFTKGEDNRWSIKADYVDNTRDPDADLEDVRPDEVSVGRLPVADFKEQDKPPQQAVIEARLDRSFLVLAPPGTGKTHTLIERLVYAITKSYREVDAGELLVLSFTRAAVGEVRERISKAIKDGAPSSLRYVQVKTFDAYATWLLNDGGYDIAGQTYDARIQLLTEKLETVELSQVTDRIGRSRYLFVDEIQDLVGVRADMVFELVKRILARKGSVTLLGDPHQSLNDYQIKENQTDSAEFLQKVQDHLSGGLEQFELKESHRYETSEMKQLAADAKLILDNLGITAEDKFSALVKLIPDISQEQLIEKFNSESVDALLCRSNGEVFRWLNWHQEQGNSCTVNAGAIGRPWPAWIGEAVMHYQQEVITYQNFISRVHSNVSASTIPSESELDNFLNNERLVRHNVINLDELAFRLKYLSPAIKGDSSEKGLIVSTVHKAKGLEYKNVVAIQPSQNNITDEEVRVLYVAITRAKKSISLLPKKQVPFGGYMKRGWGGHYRYSQNGTKFNQILGVEDFNLEALFILENGSVDQEALVNYLSCYKENHRFIIRAVSRNKELDHNYCLFMLTGNKSVKICAVSGPLQKDLNAMSLKKENDQWVAAYGDGGAMMNLGGGLNYQTIVHPIQSPILARHIGPAGVMVFPLIQGFFPLSRATGE